MVEVIFYREADGRVPLLPWFAGIPREARLKCIVRIERLATQGHQLRRPETDYLRDGIYELRAKHRGVNYRLLYFFHGRGTAVLSHGITKQRALVPPAEVDRALSRKRAFEFDPQRHTHREA